MKRTIFLSPNRTPLIKLILDIKIVNKMKFKFRIKYLVQVLKSVKSKDPCRDFLWRRFIRAIKIAILKVQIITREV